MIKRLFLAAACMLGVLSVPSAALAARSSSYAPTLTTSLASGGPVTATVASGTPYVVSGCGYNAAFGGVTIVVHQPGSVAFAGQQLDAAGCISLSNFATQGAGSYEIDAWQHVGKKDVVVATTSFTLT